MYLPLERVVLKQEQGELVGVWCGVCCVVVSFLESIVLAEDLSVVSDLAATHFNGSLLVHAYLSASKENLTCIL